MKNNIFIHFDSDGYPYRIAARLNKNELIARSLIKYGFKPYVFSKKNYFDNFTFSRDGIKNGVHYKFLNIKNKSKFDLFRAYYREYRLLSKKALQYEEKILIVSYVFFPSLLHYFIISKLFGYKIFVIMDEWHISVNGNKFLLKLNAFLYDYFAIYFTNGILPISRFLEEKIISINKHVNYLRLPILTDNQSIDLIQGGDVNYNRFLYCGSIGYIEIIEFILDSFIMLKRSLKKEELKLVLVLSGNTVLIKDFIEKHKNLLENNNIIIYSELSYKDLIILYKTSLALLIPLRKNIQDKARFSHKIGEYLASGRPIITTYWGEIKYEFIHSINALIAQDYSIESYAKMMQIAYEKPDMSDRIGDKGRKLCKEKYSYLKYGKILSEFFTKS